MEGNDSLRPKGKFLGKSPKWKYTWMIHTGAVQKNSVIQHCHDAAITAILAGDESTTQSHLKDTTPAASITSKAVSRKKAKADLTHELRCSITVWDAAMEVVDAAIELAEAGELESDVLMWKNSKLVETVQVARQANVHGKNSTAETVQVARQANVHWKNSTAIYISLLAVNHGQMGLHVPYQILQWKTWC